MWNRAKSEKKAYDKNNFWEHSHKWHLKFRHVFECPNTIRHERILFNIIKSNISRKRVLDIGCGSGISSQNLHFYGASYVLGIDISERFISEAKKREIKGRLEFLNRDLMSPIEGTYDIIFGRAISHQLSSFSLKSQKT